MALPFPDPVLESSKLAWIDACDFDGHNMRKSLCLCSDFRPSSTGITAPSTVIEGFGYELIGAMLTMRTNAIGNQEVVRMRNHTLRIRVIPSHVVQMEQKAARREGRLTSDVILPGFCEVRMSQRHMENANFGSSYVYIGGIDRQFVTASFGTVRLTLEEGDPESLGSPGDVIESQVLQIDNPKVCIELPSRPSIGRVLRSALYGEVRDGLLLEALPIDETSAAVMQYRRPPLDMTDRYPEDRLVATKVIFRSRLPGGDEYNPRVSDDPLKEIAAMQYIQAELQRQIELHGPGSERDMLLQAQEHVMRLLAVNIDNARLYMIMKLVNVGELFDIFESFAEGDIARLRSLFRQVCFGVFALHRCGVAHRDISLENVLLHNNSSGFEQCYVIDFGLCQRINLACSPMEAYVPNSRKGKTYYLPHENFQSAIRSIDAFACDIWALGVMLFIMLTGNAPFDQSRQGMSQRWYADLSAGLLRDKVVRVMVRNSAGGFDPRISKLSEAISASAMDLLAKLLDLDFSQRIKIDDLLRHPWMVEQ
jgi:serine/threonine protein kinase